MSLPCLLHEKLLDRYLAQSQENGSAGRSLHEQTSTDSVLDTVVTLDWTTHPLPGIQPQIHSDKPEKMENENVGRHQTADSTAAWLNAMPRKDPG